MVLLVTGAITPAQNISKTQLNDTEIRKEQYLSALKKCIDEAKKYNEATVNQNRASSIMSIVYCDNSNPNSIIFKELTEYAKHANVMFEVLTFYGNNEKVAEKGKGFGEGEITRYAVNNSKLLKEDELLIKLTGRLVIDNLASLAKKLTNNKCYFNIPNHTRRDICDTRLYAMSVACYKEYFISAYEKVDDNAGYYLEHAFMDVIKASGLQTYNFPEYPLYVGMSGTAASNYTYVKWKSELKNVLSFFQFYRVKWKDINN